MWSLDTIYANDAKTSVGERVANGNVVFILSKDRSGQKAINGICYKTRLLGGCTSAVPWLKWEVKGGGFSGYIRFCTYFTGSPTFSELLCQSYAIRIVTAKKMLITLSQVRLGSVQLGWIQFIFKAPQHILYCNFF